MSQFTSINPELTIVNINKPDPNDPIYNAFQLNSIPISHPANLSSDLLQYNNTNWTVTTPALLFTNLYSCSIRSTGQSLATGTLTKLTYNGIDWDTDGTMADLANNQIIIRKVGKYRIVFRVFISGNTVGTLRYASVTKNSTTISEKNEIATGYFLNYYNAIIEQCDVGDIIETFGEHDSDVNVTYGSGSQPRWITHLQVIYAGE
jgi:hypothetical protein